MNLINHKFYCFALFSLILSPFFNGSIFSQQQNFQTVPSKFEDYTIVANIDSLEKAVYAQKNTPSVFLHELIKLEVNRELRSDKFGQDLETIKKLAKEQSSDLGLIMYEYFKSTDLWKANSGEGAHVYFKIADYFEKHNDTLGMVLIYHRLMKLNLSPMNMLIGNKNIAKKYFDRIIGFGQKNLQSRVKLQILIYRSRLEYHFKDNYDIKDGLDLLHEAEGLVAKNPEFTYMLCSFYTAMGITYFNKKQFKGLLVYHLKAHEYAKYVSTYSRLVSFYNVGNAYFFTKQYAEAEKYIKEAIKIYYETKENGDEILIGMHKSLSNILFHLKKYDEAQQAWLRVDTLRTEYGEKLRAQNLLEVETKYETQKKELENKRLALEADKQKQKAELWSFSTILLILVSGATILIYRQTKEKNTELTRLNELIALRNQDLNVANQRMEHFTNTLSHDALGYINNILSYADLGQNTSHQTEFQPIFHTIFRNTSRLKGMSENLINYNKKRQITNFQKVNVKNIVLETIEDMSKRLSEEETHLEIEATLMVYANREFVKEVLKNLFHNAVKFKKEQPFKLTISAQYHSETHILVTVNDNGIGISEKNLPKIFNEFVKINDHSEGSGLGLFICKQIVENMGGHIWADSKEGEGSTFYFTLLKETPSVN